MASRARTTETLNPGSVADVRRDDLAPGEWGVVAFCVTTNLWECSSHPVHFFKHKSSYSEMCGGLGGCMFWLNTPAALDFGGTNLTFAEHRRVLETLSRDLSARPSLFSTFPMILTAFKYFS